MSRIAVPILALLFAASLAVAMVAVARDPNWAIVPAMLASWYAADLLSGLVHMIMDYRPCPAGKRLDELYFYAGSRESDQYRDLFRRRMASISAFDRLVYDFKNHHPRPAALGRRTMWRQIGSTVLIGALPLAVLLDVAIMAIGLPGWFVAGAVTFIVGGAFAQYFHGSLHRDANPWPIRALRRAGLLMTPAAHQLHHDTLQRDFSTNCGWSNPLLNRLFRVAHRRGWLTDSGLEPSA